MSVETPKPDISALRINRNAPTTSNNGSEGGSKGKMFLIWGVVLIVVLAIAYLLKGIFTPVETVEAGTVSLVYPSQANAVLTASGYVVASRKAAVASKGTGRLVYLGVEEGSHVKKDEIIGRLDASDVEAALQQAKASLIVAQANLQNAQAAQKNADSVYKREQALFGKHLISEAELDAAEAQDKQAMAQVASNEANVKLAEATEHSAEVQVEYTNIRAPFDGTVLTKDADVGDVMTPFGAAAGSRADVVTLADMASLDAEVDVSESNIEQVHVGQKCEITIDAVPDKRYHGIVHMIVPTADRSKATVLTKVDFKDIDSRVLPEMSVKVLFLSDSTAQSNDTTGPKITVPASAIATRNGKKIVFVLRDDVVTETPVTLGQTLGSGIEVTQGVGVGDKVVLHPAEDLHSGKKVATEQ
jgi:RND family efflux transporter MFP subunit